MTLYGVLADVVLLTHIGFVVFVVGGLLAVFVGGLCGRGWIRNPWFRSLHLVGIGIVVVQSWFGVICPLTTLEMALRDRAGEATYGGSFIAHWMQKLLYYEAPPWVFAVVYTLFGLAVVSSWIAFRPRSFRQRSATME